MSGSVSFGGGVSAGVGIGVSAGVGVGFGAGFGGITLGPVAFDGLEIPERLSFGGKQKFHVHQLPGGARVVDEMGRDEADLEWSGILTGPFAASRARQLDALRIDGSPLPLTWGSFFRTVIIEDFSCEYERGGFYLSYRIKCLAIPSTPGFGSPPPLLGQLNQDLGAGIGIGGQVSGAISIGPLQLSGSISAFAGMQAAIPVAGALVAGSAAFGGVQAAVSAGVGAMAGLAASANVSLTAAASLALPIPALGGVGATISLNAVGQATAGLAATAAMQPYANRMAANLRVN